jgi:hypothetical protein
MSSTNYNIDIPLYITIKLLLPLYRYTNHCDYLTSQICAHVSTLVLVYVSLIDSYTQTTKHAQAGHYKEAKHHYIH